MGRTVGARLLLTHLAVALAGVLSVASLGSYLFERFYLHERQTELVAAGQKLAVLAAPRLASDNRDELWVLSRTASAALGGPVCIYRAGDLAPLAASGTGQPPADQPAAEETVPAEPKLTTVAIACQGGLTYTATVPVKDPHGGPPLGVVVVRCPLSGVRRIVAAEWLSAGFGAAAAALLAVLLAAGLARRLARPLARLASAAAGLARGDFAVRVPTHGLAELDSLAHALNGAATQLAALFAEQQAAVSTAERLDRMRREFVANASHQLRTPLTSIRGYLTAVTDGTADTGAERERCLGIALEQVELLRRLVDQLMQLSRLQAGALPERREPTDLAELAARAADHLAPQAAARRVTISVAADPVTVAVDVDLLLQATHNLLDNALRHTAEGSTVTVTVRRVGEDLELAVADAGPGFARDEAEALWERFHSRRAGGAGLGLAIAREIVAGHGGAVFARAGEAGGAVFGFTLPAG